MTADSREIAKLSPARLKPVRDADGENTAVRCVERQRVAGAPAGNLLSQLALLQQRKEVGTRGSGGTSRSRQVVTRTTTERLTVEDETVTPEHFAVSTEPIGSLVCRKVIAWMMALVAALLGTACLFAIVNSNMAAFFVCLVLAFGFVGGFVTLNGYQHD